MLENVINSLTCKNGLAYIVGSNAGPTQVIRYSRDHFSTEPNADTSTRISCTNWRNLWRNCTKSWRKTMGWRRSDTNRQSEKKQNGKWNQETIRQCRSLYNFGTINWSSDCSYWMLVIRQLLVSRSRNGTSSDDLTATTRSSKSWRISRSARNRSRHCGRVLKRRRHEFVTWKSVFESGQRLAPRRDLRKRCSQSLTSRSMRKERRYFNG